MTVLPSPKSVSGKAPKKQLPAAMNKRSSSNLFHHLASVVLHHLQGCPINISIIRSIIRSVVACFPRPCIVICSLVTFVRPPSETSSFARAHLTLHRFWSYSLCSSTFVWKLHLDCYHAAKDKATMERHVEHVSAGRGVSSKFHTTPFVSLPSLPRSRLLEMGFRHSISLMLKFWGRQDSRTHAHTHLPPAILLPLCVTRIMAPGHAWRGREGLLRRARIHLRIPVEVPRMFVVSVALFSFAEAGFSLRLCDSI